MGRWSRELGGELVRWLERPPGGHWLEVGCGTGALTSRILELAAPASLVAVDPSATFVAHAGAAVIDPRVRFAVAGAGTLPARDGGYDAIVSLLVLNFLPDPVAALAEMRGLAAPGGTVAACVWEYAEGMEMLRRFWDAAVTLDPAARRLDEGERFPVCSPDGLEEAFRRAGSADVDVAALEIPTVFRDFDDYWRPFVGGPGPAPGYVAALTDARRQALAEQLDATLPRAADGTIRLTARAWAARARRPRGRG
jgi:SAM-dependent methyltransferase